MSEYFERIADEWRERAPELAAWTMQTMVNRTDVWGRYLPKRKRGQSKGEGTNVITAPFRDERGKVFLTESSLEKHFKVRGEGGVLGLHSTSSDLTSRWLAVDVDLHDPDNLSVSPQGNFAACKSWCQRLASYGLDPLLLDSNGLGGFHLMIIFAEPMSTDSVHAFGEKLVSDFAALGLDEQPEIFPGKPHWNHYGDWLRLPGRHHTKTHYTRVWNDEPWSDEPWLEGHDAIDRILGTARISTDLAAKVGITQARRTICLDFDGVIHSYRSGWCGAEVIPDPPIYGAREAVERLRRHFRVVVHSARSATEEGCEAIRQWLLRHNIEVDEVCMHKPPASVYVDDRAVPFRGSWEDTIAAIHDFRK